MLVEFANTEVTKVENPHCAFLLLQLGRTATVETIRGQLFLGTRSLCELDSGKNGFNNGISDHVLHGLEGVFRLIALSWWVFGLSGRS